MKPKLRVVFDTNIYLSAILFGGNPRQCLNLARTDQINLFISKYILLEIARNLQTKFLWSGIEVREVLEGILVFANLVYPKENIDIIKQEPKDNRILECALEVEADFIVSGDKKHLLSLGKFNKISIVSAKDFLDIFYHKSN